MRRAMLVGLLVLTLIPACKDDDPSCDEAKADVQQRLLEVVNLPGPPENDPTLERLQDIAEEACT